jgi:hypothetical protein
MEEDISERTKSVKNHIDIFQPYWKPSLEILGNISHKGKIPPEAISSVSIVDPPAAVRLAIDPVMRIDAIQISKGKYEMYNRLLTGQNVSRDEYLVHSRGVPIPEDMNLSDVMTESDINQLAETVDETRMEEVLGQDYITTRKNESYTANTK